MNMPEVQISERIMKQKIFTVYEYRTLAKQLGKLVAVIAFIRDECDYDDDRIWKACNRVLEEVKV